MMIGEFLALGHTLAWLTYVFGILFQTLPIPRKSIKSWGPAMMVDAVIAELALATIGVAEPLIAWASSLVQSSIGSPNPATFGLIVAELATIDGLLLTIITLTSSAANLLPLLQAVTNLLTPALTIVTSALILWIIVQFLASFLPSVWFSAYVLGLVFYAIPFRIGRRLGSYFISSSIILTIAIPLMPSLALSLQGILGYQLILNPLEEAVSTLQTNPLALFSIIFTLSTIIPRLLAAVVISLVIFPPVYFFIASAVMRGVANAIGGTSGPTVESFTLVPAYELGGAITR